MPQTVLEFSENKSQLLLPQRITIPEIIDDEWFQKDYVPSCSTEGYKKMDLDDAKAAFDSTEVKCLIQ